MFKDLSEINFASKVLQKKDIDLYESLRVLCRVNQIIANFRNCYEEIKIESENLAKRWKIDHQFKTKRQPKIKKHYDEISRDHRFNKAEELFRVNVLLYIIDQITGQIQNRFKGMKRVRDHFEFLDP